MENIFIKFIQEGKIQNIDGLKKAFRKIAKKTHPDIAGTDQFVDKFIQFKNYYDEAKRFLESNNLIQEEKATDLKKDFRLLFFQELQKLDTLELPHNHTNNEIEEKIKEVKEFIRIYFKKWKEEYYELFNSANSEYEQIKKEKPANNLANLRKPALYRNLRPVFFNLCSFHITGIQFYQRQLKRNLDLIILRLEEKKYFALKNFLLFLIKDADNGPAIFE